MWVSCHDVPDVQTNALLAVLIGAALAVVGFVPVAAYQYRRQGRYTPGQLLRTLAVPVYTVALWTYTLLPLPARDDVVCADRQTQPFHFVDDIARVWDGQLTELLRHPVFLQVALNILLFVPLGYFVRAVLGRGVLLSGMLGLGVSALIETTQLTGLWGIYPCAYRVFDVDDLIINTLGAVLGSLLSVLVVRRRVQRGALPYLISPGRRMVSLISDLLVVVSLGAVAALGWRAWQLYVVGQGVAYLDLDVQRALQYGVPFAFQAVLVLGTGRSAGEWVTNQDTGGGRLGTVIARTIKFVCGAGGLVVLAAWEFPGSDLALAGFVVLTVLGAFGPGHAGLANTVAGLRAHGEGGAASEGPRSTTLE